MSLWNRTSPCVTAWCSASHQDAEKGYSPIKNGRKIRIDKQLLLSPFLLISCLAIFIYYKFVQAVQYKHLKNYIKNITYDKGTIQTLTHRRNKITEGL